MAMAMAMAMTTGTGTGVMGTGVSTAPGITYAGRRRGVAARPRQRSRAAGQLVDSNADGERRRDGSKVTDWQPR